ncbi:hypothetical protein METHPM2_870001 [Pseudomonas sp. PM2]
MVTVDGYNLKSCVDTYTAMAVQQVQYL